MVKKKTKKKKQSLGEKLRDYEVCHFKFRLHLSSPSLQISDLKTKFAVNWGIVHIKKKERMLRPIPFYYIHCKLPKNVVFRDIKMV